MLARMRVLHLGATGAVGGHVLDALLADARVTRVTTLGRRPTGRVDPKLVERTVDVLSPDSYRDALPPHDAAICTLGVGQPSKMSKDEFRRIDHDAALVFATACRSASVKHFELLAAVGVDSKSSSFYMRTKGELEDAIRALAFDRTSFFHPSMILTPENRYGADQGFLLAVFPKLEPVLRGPARKLRGVKVDVLGRAMAKNLFAEGRGVETLEWDRFQALDAGRA